MEEIMENEEVETKEVAKAPETGVSKSTKIEGLVNLDNTDFPMPKVRLVQPTSQDTEVGGGKDAVPGTFYFSGTRLVLEELTLVVLFVKKDYITWEEVRPAEKVYKILSLEQTRPEIEPFELMITGFSSVNEFVNFLGEVKGSNMKSIRDRVIKVTSEKREGKKGKWYAMKFALGEELNDGDKIAVAQFADNYVGVAKENKPSEADEDVNTEEIPF
jgi:hypothetical protein